MREAKKVFTETVWEFYRTHGRHELPWRQTESDGSFNPYKITVSELMLQQTQVNRVVLKYEEFLKEFPTVRALADAPLGDVLRTWSGLGYNRRAKFLHQTAQQVTDTYAGQFPREPRELVKLPGIGPNTAGAICAYAYNMPVTFLETNIRTVYIHHFFEDQTGIRDSAIRDLVLDTMDHEQPREWYWALMDYGAHLKRTVGNLGRHSSTYSRQSKFEGSLRQIRGQIIKHLTSEPHTVGQLRQAVPDDRFDIVVNDLLQEGLIQRKHGRLSL